MDELPRDNNPLIYDREAHYPPYHTSVVGQAMNLEVIDDVIGYVIISIKEYQNI